MANKTAPPAKERTGRVGQGRQIVIPREIFKRLNLHEGDVVAFAEEQGAVLVRPRAVVVDTRLTVEEAKAVRRGEAQLKRGNSKAWREVKHALAR